MKFSDFYYNETFVPFTAPAQSSWQDLNKFYNAYGKKQIRYRSHDGSIKTGIIIDLLHEGMFEVRALDGSMEDVDLQSIVAVSTSPDSISPDSW